MGIFVSLLFNQNKLQMKISFIRNILHFDQMLLLFVNLSQAEINYSYSIFWRKKSNKTKHFQNHEIWTAFNWNPSSKYITKPLQKLQTLSNIQ